MNVNKNLVFLCAYVILLGAFSFAGYYFYADYRLQAARHHTGQVAENTSELDYVNLPRISVTLSSEHGLRSGNVRMDITLEVQKRYVPKIESVEPLITDRLIHYTQTLDLNEMSRPHATLWLKPDMLAEVNKVSAPAPVHDIVFREFAVY